VFIDTTVPGLTREVEKLCDAMFGVQDKITEIANAQGIPIPVPQLNMSGTQLLLMPITNGHQLVKEFTETVTDANLKLLEAQVDTLEWTVNTTVQLHNTLTSHLRDANDMLTDINKPAAQVCHRTSPCDAEPARRLHRDDSGLRRRCQRSQCRRRCRG